MKDDVVARVMNNIGKGEWFFLQQVGQNLDPYVYAELLQSLDKVLCVQNKTIEWAEEGKKVRLKPSFVQTNQ